jgi:hypothetical protein
VIARLQKRCAKLYVRSLITHPPQSVQLVHHAPLRRLTKKVCYNVYSLNTETLHNWQRVRSLLPPWLNLDTKKPILCHEITLLLRLTGRDSESNSSATIPSSAYCILFENILLFAQGSFPVFDETAAPTMPNLTCFGMVFLENLDSQGTLSQMSLSNGVPSFSLNLGRGDSMKFKFVSSQSARISKIWYHTLQTCLQPQFFERGTATYLQVATLVN